MAKVELKTPVVDEISANIKDAQSVVLVDYRGLTVEQDTALRKQLREAGITYKVCKNTMMNFAFKGTDFESLAPYLEGPSAIAVSTTDATAPARVISNFAKTAPAPVSYTHLLPDRYHHDLHQGRSGRDQTGLCDP